MPRINARPTFQRRSVLRSASGVQRPSRPICDCGICGLPIYSGYTAPDPRSLDIDHVFAKARFPELRGERWNLQPTHRICNERKGIRDPTPAEAARAIARRQAKPRPRLIAKSGSRGTVRRIAKPPSQPSTLLEALQKISI
jgi:5-methylcytosine-specific restriction endonuclease McrA